MNTEIFIHSRLYSHLLQLCLTGSKNAVNICQWMIIWNDPAWPSKLHRPWYLRNSWVWMVEKVSPQGSCLLSSSRSIPELGAEELRAGHRWNSLCLHFFSVNFCISFPLVSFPLIEADLHISGDTTPKAYHKPFPFLRVFECWHSSFARFRIT